MPNSPNHSKTEMKKCLGKLNRSRLLTSVPEMAVATTKIVRDICDNSRHCAKEITRLRTYPTDWTTGGIKRLSFLWESCDAPQILAYPMRSLTLRGRLRAFLGQRLLQQSKQSMYPALQAHDKLMTSASDDGLEV